jgi:putative oxidoreductase
MDYGLFFLRIVVGSVFFAHGAQKLFGWWGGGGLRGTAGWLGSSGFRPPRLMALAVALSESSGALLVLGVATPLVALALAATMVVAVGTAHWKNGFWAGKGGYEFNLVLWAAVIAIAAIGPGRFSIDRLVGWDDNISGVWWGVAVLALSLVSGLLILGSRQRPTVEEGTEQTT